MLLEVFLPVLEDRQEGLSADPLPLATRVLRVGLEIT